MNSASFSELVRARRSCRDFEPKEIEEEVLHKVLDDAKWAPSWSDF